MDLIAIIEHSKTANELVTINQLIDKCDDFRNAHKERYPNSIIREAKWNGLIEMREFNLLKIWEIEEKGECVDETIELKGLNLYAEMDIPYAELKFNRNTISISPHGLHKYGNFKYPEWAKFILTMNREIAKIFNSKKIVYCVDSYEDTSILYDKSIEGLNLEEIIELGNSKFGTPSKELMKAIKNFYFIDEFDLNFNDLVEFQHYRDSDRIEAN